MNLSAVQSGQVVADVERRLTREHLRTYAVVSGDDNPIHQDEAVARSVGLPNVIAHGMLTMGCVGSVVEDLVDPERIARFETRFAAPVVVPADVSVPLRIVLTCLSRDETAGTLTLEAAVSVAGTKVLSRTRAVITTD